MEINKVVVDFVIIKILFINSDNVKFIVCWMEINVVYVRVLKFFKVLLNLESVFEVSRRKINEIFVFRII